MKTALYDAHVALGAKIVDFHGWDMPLQYAGILEEHRIVREAAGVFDVSHMGRIFINGPEAEQFLDQLTTNIIAGKKDGQAIYSVLCREDGSSIDDLIIIRHSSSECSVISNASNRERVYHHLHQQAEGKNISVIPAYETEGILSLQGPESIEVAASIFSELNGLLPMNSLKLGQMIISSTGYTGEKGIELFAPHQMIVKYWSEFITKGAKPIGLGARDTLRLEKGYALYGHELSDSIAPTESVAAWAVKFEKEFLGKQALQHLEQSPLKRFQMGTVLQDPGVARAGFPVSCEEKSVGYVTSGTFSPTLKKSISLIMVNRKLNLGDYVEISIRDKLTRAEVVSLPFLTGGSCKTQKTAGF